MNVPPWLKLLLISFATLFFEVMVIRWVGSEIRMFAYLKNLTLMGCVLGLGIGCSAVTKDSLDKFRNSIIVFAALFTVLALVLAFAKQFGLTDMTFVLNTDVYNWQFGVSSVSALFINVLCLLSVFLLVVAIFDFLGQELGKQIAAFPPLNGYGINLLGSLLGVVAFSLMSFLGGTPTVWTLLGFSSIAVFCASRKQMITLALLAAVCAGLAQLSVGESIWTPYYRIDLRPLHHWYDNKAVEIVEPFQLGTVIEVNHVMHQAPFNFSESFFKEHPALYGSSDYFTYNLPYNAQANLENVLILGAGTGNDVAVCLQHNPKTVDAVEIDPGILELGRRIHPQLPYSDPRVRPHINDARAYLAADKQKYDLIVFAYLDSQTALSTLASLRLDNYLYTKEALESASRHLKENGIASLSFSAQKEWLQARLYQMVKSVYGKEPLLIRTGFHGGGSLAVLWGPGLDAVRQDLIGKYGDKVIDAAAYAQAVEIPTDDWPFLYQQERNVPPVYILMLGTVLLISSVLVLSRFRLKLGEMLSNSQFFFLGAGFLLLETRGMLAVAALFGSTWIVNSIVIGILLATALFSNWLVSCNQAKLSQTVGYCGLALTLALNYFIPLSGFAGEGFWTRAIVAFLLLGSPFVFTGIIFSSAFSKTDKPQVALGMNILGAILGGCLEYLSTVVGTSALTLLSAVIYALSALTLIAARSKPN